MFLATNSLKPSENPVIKIIIIDQDSRLVQYYTKDYVESDVNSY